MREMTKGPCAGAHDGGKDGGWGNSILNAHDSGGICKADFHNRPHLTLS